jgi:two-component system sensor histidine kinase DesK
VIARGEREVDFVTEVDNAVSLLQAAGIDVTTEITVTDLDETTSGLLGWAIREGTTNILRHASARWVSITAGRGSGGVTFELRNDGVTRYVQNGTGLRGLAERAAAAHGTAQGRLDDGAEFVLTVTVPERVLV